jgi:hypothetical protein
VGLGANATYKRVPYTSFTMSMSASTSLNAKIRCGDDVRRVALPVPTTLESLMARLTMMFNLDGCGHNGSFRLKYLDDEKDLVSITDDEELQAAIALAKDWGA